MDTFPDLGSLSDQELKDLIQQLTEEEIDISYKRRILHGKIDILRAELVNRLRKKHEGGEDVITGEDVQRLTDILAGRAGGDEPAATWRHEPPAPRRGPSLHRVRLRQRRGRQLLPALRRAARRAASADRRAVTATYRIDETGELVPVELDDVDAQGGAALVIRAGGGRVGESFPIDGERMTIGRRPDSDVFLDDVTVSRDHALLIRRGDDVVPRRPRLAERDLRQPPPHRVAPPRGGRRAADRQVQADVPRALMAAVAASEPLTSRDRGERRRAEVDDDRRGVQGAGAGVPGHLDLEDPLPRGPEAADAAPHARRLPALHASDVARLRTILRMQRDEFLPLRVIRQELAAGPRRRRDAGAGPRPAATARAPWRRASSVRGAPARCTRSRTCSRRPRPRPSSCASSKSTASSRASCAAACATSTRPSARSSRAVAELARYGVGGRNLRVFRSSADREANLLQQILAPALRSRNAQRRKEAVEALENLAAVATHLKHLLLIRDLRKIVR